MSTSSPGMEISTTTLDNGLRVVAAPDHSIPLCAVAVVYDVGFRSEPEGRTGFAHLFEHLMFQGSANVAKAEHPRLVEGAGGVMNGHTRPDLTSYFEALPSSGLDLALWLEADRMGSLALNEENLANQVAVVKEEIRVNVMNRPYGGFPWISLPPVAFDTYPNAHNGYGDFSHLEQATLEDAADFYERFYAPSNAVLAIGGDCDAQRAFALAQRYFGHIPAREAPRRPSFSEPPLNSERRATVTDPLAPTPAIAVGYRAPDPVGQRKEILSYAVLASILAEGDAARLRRRMVHEDRSVTDLSCYLGSFGDAFSMRDPVLFQVLLFHPGTWATDALLGALDEELAKLASSGPTAKEMQRAVARSAAAYWSEMDQLLERTLALADAEAIHGDAHLVERFPSMVAAIGPEDVAAAAGALKPDARAVLELEPARP